MEGAKHVAGGANRPRFSTRMQPCENLINALKLLANQENDGDSLFQSLVTEKASRRA